MLLSGPLRQDIRTGGKEAAALTGSPRAWTCAARVRKTCRQSLNRVLVKINRFEEAIIMTYNFIQADLFKQVITIMTLDEMLWCRPERDLEYLHGCYCSAERNKKPIIFSNGCKGGAN